VQFVENAAQTQGMLTVSDVANGDPTVNLVVLGNYAQTVFSPHADPATGTTIKI
jgi:pyruvate-formate lyase